MSAVGNTFVLSFGNDDDSDGIELRLLGSFSRNRYKSKFADILQKRVVNLNTCSKRMSKMSEFI